ncbi:MAG: hypothetical protein ACRCX2_27455 [Paraclostridium sp.]
MNVESVVMNIFSSERKTVPLKEALKSWQERVSLNEAPSKGRMFFYGEGSSLANLLGTRQWYDLGDPDTATVLLIWLHRNTETEAKQYRDELIFDVIRKEKKPFYDIGKIVKKL